MNTQTQTTVQIIVFFTVVAIATILTMLNSPVV